MEFYVLMSSKMIPWIMNSNKPNEKAKFAVLF